MRKYEIVLRRRASRYLTIETVASCAGVHPGLIEKYIDYNLLEPAFEESPASPLFDPSIVSRIRTIERLRGDLGINLAGVAVILDMLDKWRALLLENEQLRNRS